MHKISLYKNINSYEKFYKCNGQAISTLSKWYEPHSSSTYIYWHSETGYYSPHLNILWEGSSSNTAKI